MSTILGTMLQRLPSGPEGKAARDYLMAANRRLAGLTLVNEREPGDKHYLIGIERYKCNRCQTEIMEGGDVYSIYAPYWHEAENLLFDMFDVLDKHDHECLMDAVQTFIDGREMLERELYDGIISTPDRKGGFNGHFPQQTRSGDRHG